MVKQVSDARQISESSNQFLNSLSSTFYEKNLIWYQLAVSRATHIYTVATLIATSQHIQDLTAK